MSRDAVIREIRFELQRPMYSPETVIRPLAARAAENGSGCVSPIFELIARKRSLEFSGPEAASRQRVLPTRSCRSAILCERLLHRPDRTFADLPPPIHLAAKATLVPGHHPWTANVRPRHRRFVR